MSNVPLDLTDQHFGRLIALYPVGKDNFGRIVWHCKCDCSNAVNVAGSMLVNSHTKSCGCLHKEITTMIFTKTNCSACNCPITEKNDTNALCTYCYRIYTCWNNMKDRCYNPNCDSYKNYGGRGITVCWDWRDQFILFYQWAISNGYQSHLTIDRINNDGDYEPPNCRWATMLEQRHNQRPHKHSRSS